MGSVIKVPKERAEQLRMLSRRRQMPIADLIGEYVNAQIAAGHLPAELPGFAIERTGDTIIFGAGTFSADLSVQDAARLGAALRDCADGSIDEVRLCQGLRVLRNGRGLSLKHRGAAEERTMSRGIARDLGEWLLRVAG